MSIPADDTNTGLSDNDAVAALMGNMNASPNEDEGDEGDEDGDQSDEDGDEPDTDEVDDNPSDDDDNEDEDADNDGEEDEDQGDDAPSAKAPEVSDDTVLKVTVDGEEQEVTVASLKRLAGQEASLTRKSQEADLVGQRAAATIQGSLEVVLEDLAAYEGVDWVLEGQRMDPEEFAWHRQQFTKLEARREKIVGAATQLDQTLAARREQKLQQEAAQAVQVLSDPQTGIPGWNDTLYGDIMSFAVEAGLPKDEVAQIVNPNVIKILNDARLFRQGQKAGAEKLNLTPTKVKKSAGRERIPAQTEKAQKALDAKVRSGTATDDDAMAALMGRWGVKRR